ncbi:MAG TPA: hypothetical protein VK497_03325 [Candidatus Saccharimonadales bacterium]|nr:hypothetical protein [Candidatus Saccharimonadales bacterium]
MDKLERGVVLSFDEDEKIGKLVILNKKGQKTGIVLDFRYRAGQFVEFDKGEVTFSGPTSFIRIMTFPAAGDELIFKRSNGKITIWTDAEFYDSCKNRATLPFYRLITRRSGGHQDKVRWSGYGLVGLPDFFTLKSVDGRTIDPLTHPDYNGAGVRTTFEVYIADGCEAREDAVFGAWVSCNKDPRHSSVQQPKAS